MPIIPKIIHFIWAGGVRLMPQRNITTLLNWCRANQDAEHSESSFKVWLWVDRETTPNLADYRNADLYPELCAYLSREQVEIHDISEVLTDRDSASARCIRYEIERLRPNYGASSDLLRYQILFKFGGAYFDSDVDSGETSLIASDIPFGEELPQHVLYVDYNSQNQGQIGNDAFFCTAGNPLINSICDIAVQNHTRGPHDTSFFNQGYGEMRRVYEYDEAYYIEKSTPFQTGTAPVTQLCSSLPGDFVRPIPLELRHPQLENQRYWVNRPFQDGYGNLHDTIAMAIRCMDFEVREMGFLRLDGYIYNVVEIHTSAERGSIVDEFLKALNSSTEAMTFAPLSRGVIAQLTGRYPETEEFYRSHMLTIPGVFFQPDDTPSFNFEAFYLATYRNILEELATEHGKIDALKEVLKKGFPVSADAELRRTQGQSIDLMNRGLDFIDQAVERCNKLISHEFACDIGNVKRYLELVEKAIMDYNQYCAVLIDRQAELILRHRIKEAHSLCHNLLVMCDHFKEKQSRCNLA